MQEESTSYYFKSNIKNVQKSKQYTEIINNGEDVMGGLLKNGGGVFDGF